MDLSNLFKNKAYVVPSHIAAEDSEIELVKTLLESLDKPIFAENIKFISETENYDVYKYESEGYSYCIKISLDPNCKEINHESKHLKKINSLIRPAYIKDGVVKVGDELRYIITSCENVENLNDLGRSYFLDNFDSFCDSYRLMQQSDKINVSYKDHLSEYFEMSQVENLMEDSLQSIKDYTNFPLINNIMKNMKNELMVRYDESFSNQKFICHGSLNGENIISKNGLFKFVNFGKCYSSHCFLDLNEIVIELGLPENIEFDLLETFCHKLNMDMSKDSLKMYKKCQQIVLIKKGIQLIMSYLKEVYVFDSRRIGEILKISDKFSQSYNRYMTISHFKNNEDFILKTITEPILSQKA
jgi:thiamine kinase-like enzyme